MDEGNPRTRRRSKEFVEPAIKRILEYENDLVNCLRELVQSLEDVDRLTECVQRLEKLVVNESTIHTFVGLGAIKLLIYVLSSFPDRMELRVGALHVLSNLASSGAEAQSAISDSEGAETLMDLLFELQRRQEHCQALLSTLTSIANIPKAQEVMVNRKFYDFVIRTVQECDDQAVVCAVLEPVAILAKASLQVRSTASANSVDVLVESLRSSFEADADEMRERLMKLLLEVIGNLCHDTMSKKSCLHKNGGVELILEILKSTREADDVHERGCLALANCATNHEGNIKAILAFSGGLGIICEEMRRFRNNFGVTDACLDVLLSVANLNATSFECPYATELSDAGTVDLVVELLKEQKSNMLKMANYLGRVGLKPNLKDKMVEAGVIRILIDSLQLRPLKAAAANGGLCALANVVSGSGSNKATAGEGGVIAAVVELVKEHQHHPSRECVLVLENSFQLLANLTDGCQANLQRASDTEVINSVLRAMESRINHWKVQELGCNFLVKVAGFDDSLTNTMMSAEADKIAEKVLSTHSGNMMVESGARTLLDLINRGRRGRDLQASGGPTVRRQSRPREKAPDALTRGSSRGPMRDKSVSPTKERGARRRGTSMEPTMNRRGGDIRRAGRSKPQILETVQE
mmetsp:Transcript_12385/g.37786  ORF Transcript_12385/g.37786 Transcript_12385/m.37786 type:complete len:638 (+) Transcript_12385:383-2296(+)